MKKKSSRGKNEDKTHKNSRRKRKSSSSESDDGNLSEVQTELIEDTKSRRSRKTDKEPENNSTAGVRVTRHSRRLAAISASDDNRETTPEIHSPTKTEKSSPYSGSPVKDKKDGTPDKHKVKDSEVWKVKPAVSSTGEIQKLKICRQRSPGEIHLDEEADVNNKSAESNECNDIESIDAENINSPISNDDIANIQLPPSEPEGSVESVAVRDCFLDISQNKNTICNTFEIENIELPPEPEPNDVAGTEIELPSEYKLKTGIKLLPEPEPKCTPEAEIDFPSMPESIPEVKTVIGLPTNPEPNQVLESEILLLPITEVPQVVHMKETEQEMQPSINAESISESMRETMFDPAVNAETEQSSKLSSVTEVEIIRDAEVKESETESVRKEEPTQKSLCQISGADELTYLNRSYKVENKESEKLKKLPVQKEESLPSPQQALSEQEDGFQAELVLTVEDNVMEEQTNSTMGECDDTELVTKTQKTRTRSILPSLQQVEMEEEYDYEHDDVKEEGELSAQEAMSPIHGTFKKYPVEERKRTWGVGNVFYFNRSSMIANEKVLRDLSIKKRTISKDVFESSDTEDLIFVKEIREENIVHDIESETNNTSLNDKDADDLSPSLTGENIEIRRKNTLESDKLKDKSLKKYTKDSRNAVNGEGKTVLYITNLVRPFTVNQLRELLQRTGKIVEDGFWIDSIKSKCYVQFENDDQAVETRHALHGIRWPVNNPKVLNVHFATPDDLIAAQVQTDESEIPRKTEPLVVSNHNSDSQRRIDWKKHFEQYDERPRKLKDVREWDIGKPEHPDDMIYADADDFKKKEDRDGRGRRDRKRRNDAPEENLRVKRHKKTLAENQQPSESKLLDDLFKRTIASPSIYWLPLSDEQIAVKQEARRKHLEELEKQIKRGNDRDPLRRRDRERRRSRR